MILRDVLKLEVQQPPALANLIANPNGDRGTHGWDYRPGRMRRVADPGGTGGSALELLPTGAGFSILTARELGATPGLYFAMRLQVRTLPSPHTARLDVDFVAADRQSLTRATVSINLTVGLNRVTPVLLPANTAYIAISVYPSWSSSAAASTRQLVFREVVAAQGTQAAVTNLPVLDPVPYVDVLDHADGVRVRRAALDVGSIDATIRDATLDPSTSTVLRGGRVFRLTAPMAGVWTPLMTGRLDDAPVTYDLTNPVARRRSVIALSGLDAVAELGNASAISGAANVADLTYSLTFGTALPWNLNGSVDQATHVPATRVHDDPDAKALDQIIMTRDTRRAQAWVDRDGVTTVYDTNQLPADVVATLTPADYGEDIDVRYDLEKVINQVMIVLRRLNAATGEIVEVPFGPFEDTVSRLAHGPRLQTFTVQGIPDTAAGRAQITAHARAILAANSTPKRRVISVSVPVELPAHLARNRSHLELLDLVRVVDAGENIDQQLRVTSIEHEISPTGGLPNPDADGLWIIRLGFDLPESTATPQQVSAPGNAVVSTYETWTPLTLTSDFIASDANPVPEFKILGGVLYMRGRVRRADGANFTAGAGFSIGSLPLAVPLTGNDRSPAPAPVSGDLSAIGSVFINSADYTVSVTAGRATRDIHVRGQFPL